MQNLLQVCVHFVWATWDRLPLITDDIEASAYGYIRQVCADDHCRVLAVGGMPDHVHLLVAMSSTVSMAQLMQHVKGGSSRLISQNLRPAEWFQWQGSYGAFAVCARDRAKIIAYINNQKAHHTDGILWQNAEQTHAESPNSVSAQADTWPQAR